MKRFILALALILSPSLVWAQASYTVKDAGGVTRTVKSNDCSSTICPIFVPVDTTGAAFGVTANPFFVTSTTLATSAKQDTLLSAVQAPIPTQAPTVSIGGVGIVDSAGTNVATVKAASTAPVATDKSVVVALNPNAGIPASINQYPFGATPYTATATGTTGATTATLTGASSVTTYLCGFSIRANATAAATGNATVTGTITATLNFTQWTAPNASGLGITEMIFAPCIPASTTNTNIAVVSAAPGTGGVVSVTAWGYKL
jgi:hypothetical protein